MVRSGPAPDVLLSLLGIVEWPELGQRLPSGLVTSPGPPCCEVAGSGV
jgi:hypothetical protein